jgi:hypothetical protein
LINTGSQKIGGGDNTWAPDFFQEEGELFDSIFYGQLKKKLKKLKKKF